MLKKWYGEWFGFGFVWSMIWLGLALNRVAHQRKIFKANFSLIIRG